MQFKIAVCGSGREFDEVNIPKARQLGKEIAKQGATLLTGAGSGLPYEAVKGAREAKGFVKGVSPAKDEKGHLERYGFSTEGFDEIEFTGKGIPGRNFNLVMQSDAVVIIEGRVGTLNELTITLVEKKPVGILEGSGGVADKAREIIKLCKRETAVVVYSKNPAELVAEIIKILNKK